MRFHLINAFLLCSACNAALTADEAFGQFTTVLNIPPDPNISSSFQSIGSNTQLNLSAGGYIGENFAAGDRDGASTNVEVNIFDGSIGMGFTASKSRVNISGGDVGFNFDIRSSTLNMSGGWLRAFMADGNSSVNISGGLVGRFESREGTNVKITGGKIGDQNLARSGSVVDISGGDVGSFSAIDGGVINVSSGALVNGFFGEQGSIFNVTGGNAGGSIGAEIRTGSSINFSGGAFGGKLLALSGAAVTISGGEFRLNGALINGLNAPGDILALDVPASAALSGTLSDGTPFAFSSLDGGDSFAEGVLTLKATQLPAIGATTSTINNNAQLLLGVRAGQTLLVESGGVLAQNFNAGRGSSVQVRGGTVGDNFEAVAANVSISSGSIGSFFDAYPGSTVLITGGIIGNSIDAFDQSVVTIAGGSVGSNFRASGGSTVNISGGSVGRGFTADSESEINISGGIINADFQAKGGSLINISGGTISSFIAQSGSTVNVSGGTISGNYVAASGSLTTISSGKVPSSLTAVPNSQVVLLGTKFVLDGIDITSSLSAGQPYIVAKRDVPFSGMLADGSPFSMSLLGFSRTGPSFSPSATLKLILVPEPASLLLTVVLPLSQLLVRDKRTLKTQS